MMTRETIYALTSLSPALGNVPLVQECIQSWRKAGCQVCSFNHPSEIGLLSNHYDVDFVPVAETTLPVFGKHLIPIKAMLDWAAEKSVPVLLINSDILLRLEEWEMKRLRWLSDGGLCYFVRFNHDGDRAHSSREAFGIDAFLFHGRDVPATAPSFLCMGQPFWDYWLPYEFVVHNRPIYTVEFPGALHLNHLHQWAWEDWLRCALELVRISGVPAGDRSYKACDDMSVRVRQTFDRGKNSIPQRPIQIRDWVQKRFGDGGAKTFLELGAHRGSDTAWMAGLPGVMIHAFEPDPRNQQPPRPNVQLHRSAIAEHDGTGFLLLSQQGWGQEWTYSSSIMKPKNHLQRYPVTFDEAVEVPLTSLDTFYWQQGSGIIDFIWADIQGAEGEMVRGGRQALEHTRYLYTEYSDDELYEKQATLKEILELLPNFRVLELWPEDVLLENRRVNL
jgi:2-O-methyltransferase